MFVNFNNIFKGKPQSQQKVPQVIVEEMNRSLDNDLKAYLQFEALDDGTCILRNNTKKLKIGGFLYDFTEEQKDILGNNPSANDVAFYLYNSQEKINLIPQTAGFFTINGKTMRLDSLIQRPLEGISYNLNEISIISPSTENKTTYITLGTKQMKKTFSIKRLPNKSLSELKFESDPQGCLYISITFNIKTKLANFTFTCNIHKAKSVKELCDNLVIYNAFRAGNGYFMNEPIEGNLELNGEDNKWADDAEQFWKKVLEIEIKLNVHFNIPDTIEDENFYLVEELYQSLIMNTPTQARYKITSLTGKWIKGKSNISYDDLKGHPLTLNLVTINEIILFGITTQLPVLTVISDALISTTKKANDGTTIYLEEKNSKQRNAIQYFTSMEELDKYRISLNLDLFQNAPSVSDLLNEPSN